MALEIFRRARFGLIRAAALPALATALVWTPVILASIPAISGVAPTDDVVPLAPPVLLLTLFFISAPAVAMIVNWRWPSATSMDRATYAALPQVFVSPALAWIWVRLEVARGYLVDNTSEEAMTGGILISVAVIAGLILMILVAGAGRLGTLLREPVGPQSPDSR